MYAILDPSKVSPPLNELNALTRQDTLKDSAKFGLLRQAVINFPDLERFVMYCGDDNCKDSLNKLKSTIAKKNCSLQHENCQHTFSFDHQET